MARRHSQPHRDGGIGGRLVESTQMGQATDQERAIANRYQHVTTAGPLERDVGCRHGEILSREFHGLFEVAAIMMRLNQKAGGQDTEFIIFPCPGDA